MKTRTDPRVVIALVYCLVMVTILAVVAVHDHGWLG